MDVVTYIRTTVAEIHLLPNSKGAWEKSVLLLITLVMAPGLATGDSCELGSQAVTDKSVTDSKTSATREPL